ncbi:hypothetical protein FCI23_51445 [Actinacidiphila oryziradicis]|uniref:Uncharacterized protein n=1 Tax=Actinacidiphila oryziradicis TaxID=2571141 RepID=A0A4U0RLB3_9ACTN|nr:hypothetical protein FCI23_51445 [Actinacidiphila oryziradicis]
MLLRLAYLTVTNTFAALRLLPIGDRAKTKTNDLINSPNRGFRAGQVGNGVESRPLRSSHASPGEKNSAGSYYVVIRWMAWQKRVSRSALNRPRPSESRPRQQKAVRTSRHSWSPHHSPRPRAGSALRHPSQTSTPPLRPPKRKPIPSYGRPRKRWRRRKRTASARRSWRPALAPPLYVPAGLPHELGLSHMP